MKIWQGIKDYFSLKTQLDDNSEFNFAVKPVKPEGFGKRLADYFDLASDYRKADKLATDIMALANAEGVAKGRFDSSTMSQPAGYQFSENDTFSIKVDRAGRVYLKCDASFAEKVKALPSAGSVETLAKSAAPAPKTDAPKP